MFTGRRVEQVETDLDRLLFPSQPRRARSSHVSRRGTHKTNQAGPFAWRHGSDVNVGEHNWTRIIGLRTVSDKKELAGAALEQAQSELRDGFEGARRVVARTRFLLGGDEMGGDEEGNEETGPAEVSA